MAYVTVIHVNSIGGELSDDLTNDISDNSIIPLAAASQKEYFYYSLNFSCQLT